LKKFEKVRKSSKKFNNAPWLRVMTKLINSSKKVRKNVFKKFKKNSKKNSKKVFKMPYLSQTDPYDPFESHLFDLPGDDDHLEQCMPWLRVKGHDQADQ
jgi:hypothetical protein